MRLGEAAARALDPGPNRSRGKRGLDRADRIVELADCWTAISSSEKVIDVTVMMLAAIVPSKVLIDSCEPKTKVGQSCAMRSRSR